MSCERADSQQRLLASLQRRAAVRQIDRRGFLRLAAAIGVQSSFAEVLADETMAAPTVQDRGGHSIKTWTNTLATYAGPVIGKLAVEAIETAHIMQVLRPIWTDKPETASRLR